MELLALCQGVANLEDAVVRQADDVASPRFVDGALSLRHKLGWRRKANGLPVANMQIWCVSLETS